RLSFTQIGLLTFTFQFTASLLQPLVGAFADKSPRPYSLATGMGFTLAGLVLLAFADSYALLLFAAALIGTGSSVFHPESSRVARAAGSQAPGAPRRHVVLAITVLLALVFSKYVYLASVTSYYTFYLIDHFHVSVRTSQLLLFVFLASAAVGGMAGGPLGDRLGSKYIIWASILGVLPFTLLLPHANLFWTCVLTVPIGLILASAFPAIVVYAQDLLPGRTGMVAGLFFGLAFGMGSVGAAVLGKVADHIGIDFVYQLCAFLPLIGLLAALLPDVHKQHTPRSG